MTGYSFLGAGTRDGWLMRGDGLRGARSREDGDSRWTPRRAWSMLSAGVVASAPLHA